MSKFNWSDNQNIIFQEVLQGSEHLEVEAAAGSGKTTTIMESIYRLPSNINALYLVFNKHAMDSAIASARKKGIPQSRLSIKTFHKFGLELIFKNNPNIDLKLKYKHEKSAINLTKLPPVNIQNVPWIDDIVGKFADNIRGRGLYTITGEDIDKYLDENLNEIIDIKELFSTSRYQKGFKQLVRKEIKERISILIEYMDEDISTCNYDDMLRQPILYNYLKDITNYDIIFIDESQDMAPIQHETIRRLSQTSRVVYVGDRSQAIYAFRGATVKSMNDIREILNPKILNLPISYRVPSNIITYIKDKELAQSIDIVPEKEGGKVISINQEDAKLADVVEEHDIKFILSAKNKHLMKAWASLVERDIKCQFKDIKTTIVIYNWLKEFSGSMSISDLLSYLIKLKKTDKTSESSETVEEFIKHFGATQLSKNVSWLRKQLHKIQESNEGIKLHTIHSAKGDESDNVLIINDSWFYNEQLDNMKYVAYTRAKNKLVLYGNDEISDKDELDKIMKRSVSYKDKNDLTYSERRERLLAVSKRKRWTPSR